MDRSFKSNHVTPIITESLSAPSTTAKTATTTIITTSAESEAIVLGKKDSTLNSPGTDYRGSSISMVSTKVPILKEVTLEKCNSVELNTFTTYLSSLLGVIAEYNSNHAQK